MIEFIGEKLARRLAHPMQSRISEIRSWLRDLALACASGGLLILCFPKFQLDLLTWVGLVPLFLAIEGKKPFRGFVLSFVTGWCLFSGVFYWIWSVQAFNFLDYLLLAVYLSIYPGVFGLVLRVIRSRTTLPLALIAPPLWVTLEYLRAHAGFLGVPWMLLGHSQYLHPWLIQITSLTGVYGLSFLIVLVNAVLAEEIAAVRLNSWADHRHSASRLNLNMIIIAASLLGGSIIYGGWVVSHSLADEGIRVAVVQGNIPQDQKWDQTYRNQILARYMTLTRDAAAGKPTLIVWPETAVPGDVQHAPALLEELGGLARESGSYLLVGSAANAKFAENKLAGKKFNSLVLLSPDGTIAGEYRKQILVPFGEYTPLKGIVRWSEAVAAPRQDILAGDRSTLFTMGSLSFGATLCWENVFPDLFREFVKGGARLMINSTNEAWFGDTAAPYQFLAMSVFRAAENRIAVVRSANTGISAFIDPYGRIVEQLKGADGKSVFLEGALTGTVPLSKGPTFYTRYGDVFAFCQTAACVLILLYALLIKWRRELVHQQPRHSFLREEDI
jgi:apolipoprotein N-acyltransferase